VWDMILYRRMVRISQNLVSLGAGEVIRRYIRTNLLQQGFEFSDPGFKTLKVIARTMQPSSWILDKTVC
jgi:hypothetical protein